MEFNPLQQAVSRSPTITNLRLKTFRAPCWQQYTHTHKHTNTHHTCTSKSVSSNRVSCIFFSSSIWRSLFFSVSNSGFSCWMVKASNCQGNMMQLCKKTTKELKKDNTYRHIAKFRPMRTTPTAGRQTSIWKRAYETPVFAVLPLLW